MLQIKLSFPPTVLEIAAIFQEHEFELYAVGGVIRDMILYTIYPSLLPQKNPNDFPYDDIDFATNALPEDIQSIFKHTIPTGIEYGTVTVLFKSYSFEITTYRKDEDYTDNRHPSNIQYTSSIKEDLMRRDFTVNAIAVNPLNNELIDINHGIQDINNKIITCVGNPHIRFQEDALRMLRAIRFATTLQFTLESNTLVAIQNLAHTIRNISKERILIELRKILCANQSYRGIDLLAKSTLFSHLIPLTDILNPKEIIMALQSLPSHIPININSQEEHLRIALLFSKSWQYIIKNPDSNSITGNNHYLTHLTRIMKELKFSNASIKAVTALVSSQHYIKMHTTDTTHALTLYIRLSKYQLAYLVSTTSSAHTKLRLQYLQIHIILLQTLGFSSECTSILHTIEFSLSLLNNPIFLSKCITPHNLAINGTLLITHFKKPSGKWIGILLSTLHRHVLRYPKDNTQSTLLHLIKTKYRLSQHHS